MKTFHPIAASLTCVFFATLTLLTASAAPEKITGEEAPVFRHMVCFSFKEEATEKQIAEITSDFLALKEKVPTIIDLEWGLSENIEPLNGDFTHGFLVTFEDKKGLEVYLPHPDHKAFVGKLRPLLDQVFVFDFTGKRAL